MHGKHERNRARDLDELVDDRRELRCIVDVRRPVQRDDAVLPLRDAELRRHAGRTDLRRQAARTSRS